MGRASKMDAEALQQACQSLQKVLNEAHVLMQDSGGLMKISDAPGSLFCPAIPIVGFHCKTFKDLDILLKRTQDTKEQDEVERFWDLEEEWDTTLKKIDAMLSPNSEDAPVVTKIGEKAPLQVLLQNARNPQESMTLKEVLMKTSNSRVHLILLRHLS